MRKLVPDEVMVVVFAIVSIVAVVGISLRAESPPPGAAPKPPGEEPTSLAFPPVKGTYYVLVREAVDGDTVHFYWLVPDTARLYGINAPEMHGDDAAKGVAAKAFLERQLSTRPVVAKVAGREKYGRALIDLFTEDGKSISALMVDGGHAKTWDGKGARP